MRLINARTCHISCFSFQFCLSYQNGGVRSKTRMFGYLGYRGYIFSNFYKSDFSIFTYNTKTWITKIRDFQTSVFSIFAYGQIQKIRDFQTSVFSIFAYSQIRKLGSQNPRFLNVQREHPAFLIFVNIQLQKLRFFRQ